MKNITKMLFVVGILCVGHMYAAEPGGAGGAASGVGGAAAASGAEEVFGEPLEGLLGGLSMEGLSQGVYTTERVVEIIASPRFANAIAKALVPRLTRKVLESRYQEGYKEGLAAGKQEFFDKGMVLNWAPVLLPFLTIVAQEGWHRYRAQGEVPSVLFRESDNRKTQIGFRLQACGLSLFKEHGTATAESKESDSCKSGDEQSKTLLCVNGYGVEGYASSSVKAALVAGLAMMAANHFLQWSGQRESSRA